MKITYTGKWATVSLNRKVLFRVKVGTAAEMAESFNRKFKEHGLFWVAAWAGSKT